MITVCPPFGSGMSWAFGGSCVGCGSWAPGGIGMAIAGGGNGVPGGRDGMNGYWIPAGIAHPMGGWDAPPAVDVLEPAPRFTGKPIGKDMVEPVLVPAVDVVGDVGEAAGGVSSPVVELSVMALEAAFAAERVLLWRFPPAVDGPAPGDMGDIITMPGAIVACSAEGVPMPLFVEGNSFVNSAKPESPVAAVLIGD